MPTRELKCIVVTPERTVVEEAADFVAVPMFDGELGVAPGRAPLIGRLGFGELRTVKGGQTRRYYVDGGFVQVKSNAVTVLTPRASKAEEISLAKVEEHLAAVKAQPGHAATAVTEADARARAQRRLAAKLRAS
jgi:F-type H+-transporting ATPase subunit epsilon